MNHILALLCTLFFLMSEACIAQSNSSSGNEYVPVTGKVTDQNGSPLKDIQVHYMLMKGTLSSHQGKFTDNDGSFTLQLMKESNGIVFANAPEQTPMKVVDYKLLSSPTDNIDLVLKSKGQILSGTVVDSQGLAIPDALLAIGALSPKDKVSHRIGLVGAGPLYTTADGKGNFSIENLPALPLIIYAARPGEKAQLHSMYLSYPKDATVDLTGGSKQGLKLTLDKPQ